MRVIRGRLACQWTAVGTAVLIALGCAATVGAAAKTQVVWGLADWAWMHQDGWPERVEAEFEKAHPDIDLKVETIADYWSKLPVLATAGTLPDVFYIDFTAGYYPYAVTQGALLNIKPFLDAAGLKESDYQPGALQTYSYNGGVYGIAHGLTGNGLYYNKNLFDEAGVAYPGDDWTWNTLADQARKLTKMDPSGTTTTFGYGFASDLGWGRGSWWEWAWQFGGNLMDPAEQHLTFDEPNAIAGVQFAVDLMWKNHISPRPQEYNGAVNMFLQQKTAMLSYWEEPMQGLNAQSQFDWGIAMPPSGPAGRGFALLGGGYGIAAQTKEPQAAWTFLNWLTAHGLDPLVEVGFVKGATQEQIPLFIKSVAQKLPTDQALVMFKSQQDGRLLPLKLRQNYDQFFSLTQKHMGAAARNEISVKSAADGLTQALKGLLNA